MDFSTISLAWRNIFRNRKRTFATVSAVMMSCSGLLLFSGYVTWARRAGESHAIIQTGHLQLFRTGFYERGAGNPTAFTIDGYDHLRRIFKDDPMLRPKLQLVTGHLMITGLASSADSETTAPFLGIGVFPRENRELIDWNPYHVYEPRRLKINESILKANPEWNPDDKETCSLGVGLAAILQVSMDRKPGVSPPSISTPAFEVPGLKRETPSSITDDNETRPQIELLCLPPSSGAPNMTSLRVSSIVARPTKDLDDRLLKLPVETASGLVFPGEETKVTSIIILLWQTRDLPAVKKRIGHLIRENNLDLEVKEWVELAPDFPRSMAMLDMFFTFTLCVVGVVLIFSIFNTVNMGITERIREIGTARAMGLDQAGVIRGFLLEGLFLGLIGGTLGVILGLASAAIINRMEFIYHPPIVPYYAKLEVFVWQNPLAVLASFSGCLLMSVISSYPAARRASRMKIADALRHS